MALLECSTLAGAFLSESAAVHAPGSAVVPIHFAYQHGSAKLDPKSATDLTAGYADYTDTIGYD